MILQNVFESPTREELDKLWQSVLAILKLVVSEAAFTTYLKFTELDEIRVVGDRLVCYVSCGSAFVKDTIEKRYWGQLCDELSRLTVKQSEVVLRVANKHAQGLTNKEVLPLFEEKKIDTDIWKKARLNEDYIFENYAVGGSNQMAYAAAQAVAKKPGKAYNPLFLYGGVGVGKTHLMQAIGHEVLKTGATAVLFCSGEEFTNDLVEAIRYKSTDKVRAKYRKVKLLMIDDIQFIAGKTSVQEEFFHTFNSIQREGGQVVMTSDRPPGEIAKLEERLRSRFGAGLIVDIGQPDFELRTAILLIKAKQRGVDLEMEVAQTIATHIEGIRELQGFLSRLITESEMKRGGISVEEVERILKLSRPNVGESRVITPSEVMVAVGNYYGVGLQQLKGDRRTKIVAWPRQVLMYLLVHELRLPLEEVGRLLGGRDHTTVMHARNKVEIELQTNPKLKTELVEVRKKILANEVVHRS